MHAGTNRLWEGCEGEGHEGEGYEGEGHEGGGWEGREGRGYGSGECQMRPVPCRTKFRFICLNELILIEKSPCAVIKNVYAVLH